MRTLNMPIRMKRYIRYYQMALAKNPLKIWCYMKQKHSNSSSVFSIYFYVHHKMCNALHKIKNSVHPRNSPYRCLPGQELASKKGTRRAEKCGEPKPARENRLPANIRFYHVARLERGRTGPGRFVFHFGLIYCASPSPLSLPLLAPGSRTASRVHLGSHAPAD